MANCSVCGSTLLHYENPDREICPTPQRHEASKGPMRDNGRRSGEARRGKPGKSNLPRRGR